MKNELKDKNNLIMYLEYLRDTEATKPVDEMDTDLIESCVQILLDLQDKTVTLSPEEINERVSNIPFDNLSSFNEQKNKKKKPAKVKRILIIAACVGILVALLGFTSTGTEYSILKNLFGKITNAPFDVSFSEGNDSEIRSSGTMVYESFADAEKSEGINILEPQYIPDNLEIIELTFHNGENNIRIGNIFFEDAKISFDLKTDSVVTDDIKSYTYKEIINDFECYFVEMDDVGLVMVNFEHDGNLYSISYTSKDEIVKMIENLKK